MKIICFLGTTDYKQTTFVWNDQECVTRFFPVAMAQFMHPEQILICATPTVRASPNLAAMGAFLDEKGVPWQVVDIPEGHSEADLWVIFDALTGVVESGETVAFDVTHSFRSLPFLAFLAVAYLRIARNVHVERVLYGAWEARDQQANRSPVFDLTPFVGLLDWITATDQFVQTGNAKRLAQLLASSGGSAREAARDLENVSQAALVCQPFTLMQNIPVLKKSLEAATAQIAQSAPPFNVLLQKMLNEFELMHGNVNDPRDVLFAEYAMLEWYYKNHQYVQFVTLAREWLIDAVTARLGEALDYNLEKRKPLEEAISGYSLIGEKHPQEQDRKFTPDDLNRFGSVISRDWTVAEKDILKTLWRKIKKVRNSIDHAQHQTVSQRKGLTPVKIQTLSDEVMQNLHELAEQWDLHHPVF